MTTSGRSRSGGFTLMELIIASALAVMVLMGVVNVSMMMTRQHLQGVHRGEINGMTLAALDAVNRDIAASSYIYVPSAMGPTGDSVGGCTNWSSQAVGPNVGGKLDPSQPVTYFLYCIDGSGARFSTLYHYGGTIPDCQGGVALPSGCGGTDSRGDNPGIVVRGDGANIGVSRSDSFAGYYFARSRGTNGVELHYIVGNSTPTKDTAGHPGLSAPQFYKVDTTVSVQRSFNTPGD
jgi:hypothetical protein